MVKPTINELAALKVSIINGKTPKGGSLEEQHEYESHQVEMIEERKTGE